MRRRPVSQLNLTECLNILGLERGATLEETKRAYRKLMFRYHPDVNGGDPARQEQFLRIKEAYHYVEQCYRGLGLHEYRASVSSAPPHATAGSEWPLRTAYDYWRRLGYLVSLALVLIIGIPLLAQYERSNFIVHQFFYLGSMILSGGFYGLGLLLFHPPRRNRLLRALRLRRF